MLRFVRRGSCTGQGGASCRPVEALEGRRLLSAAPDVGVEAGGDDVLPGTLVPDVSASLPAAVVAGAKTRPVGVVVTVTNADVLPFSGPATVALFATANETFEPEADPQLATTTKRLKLEPGQSKAVKLKVTAFPNVPDGDYRVLARVTAPGIDPAANPSFNTVNVAAAFIDLAGTPGAAPETLVRGKKARLTLTLTNGGNSAVKTTVPVAITAGLPPDVAGQPVALGTVNAKVSLKAGQSKTVKLSVKVPQELAAGTYFLDAVLDPANVLAERNEANNEILGTAEVTVAP